ncbi:MAG: hypothetical protein ABMA13_11120 [Chthoniobacteraceae bacterium]
MIEDIRRLLDAAPFRSFTIHLADGRTVQVRHPDFVFPGHFGSVVIEGERGGFDIVSAGMITGLKIEEEAPRA